MILGVDPGSTHSGWVIYDPKAARVRAAAWERNGLLYARLIGVDLRSLANSEDNVPWFDRVRHLGIEMMRPRGERMSIDAMITLVWVGRFWEVANVDARWFVFRNSPPKVWTAQPYDGWPFCPNGVCMHLCGRVEKTAALRQVLIDRFGPGRKAAIGTNKERGPLFGVPGDGDHKWDALAVAVTLADWLEQERNGK